MAKQEIYTCDFCESKAKFTLTLIDRDLNNKVKETDLCYDHFNRLRVYINKGLPLVKNGGDVITTPPLT